MHVIYIETVISEFSLTLPMTNSIMTNSMTNYVFRAQHCGFHSVPHFIPRPFVGALMQEVENEMALVKT